jgi:UDP-2,3-diacylglucosamine pyrophosphatase LpxH
MVFAKKWSIELEKKDDIIHLEPLSDLHIGHVGFDEDLYKKRIRAISKNHNRYTIFLGDQLDAITTFDKRFNPDISTEHDIDNQRKTWQTLSQPLIDVHKESNNKKICGLLHGNHEYNIREITRSYIENQFCEPNGIDFLGSRAIIGLEITYKKKILGQWTILAIHGSGGGKPERMFDQMKKNVYADIFLCGHLHQKRYTPEIVNDFDFDTGKRWEREIHLVNAGTFCHTVVDDTDGYMDRKNEIVYGQIGTTTLSIDAFNGKVVGHI